MSVLKTAYSLLLCLISAAQPAFSSGFGPVTVYPADQGPVSAVITDANQDGNLDLVVVNTTSNDISVLLGNGDGTFQPPVNYAVGKSPVSVVAAVDFSGDGNIDIAVVNQDDNTLSVLLGNGDGTFQSPVTYSLGSGTNPRAIQLTVLTVTGNFDLVVANAFGGTANQGTVAVLLGNGDGTFQPAVNYDTLGAGPSALSVGDFNNDGKPDVALANSQSNSVSIFLADGKGGLTGLGDYPAGAGPVAITLWGAFPDLVVTNPVTSAITILDNTGGGTFSHSRTYPVGAVPTAIINGKFRSGVQADGLAVANTNGTVTVFPGTKYLPRTRKPLTFPTCSSPSSIVTADVNHDNKLDLILACSDGVGIMLNTGP